MLNHDYQPVIYYYNPNIFPAEEYEIRKRECSRYALKLGVSMIDGDYGHQQWCEEMKGLEDQPERGARCLQCFKMRLLKAAEKAKELNIELFTTTLASSRWKDLKQINEAGFWAAGQVEGTQFWDKNWRKDGLQERRNQLLKENNFYNQQYCGCEFSLKATAAKMQK
jgi:predicted adenine nucleotide alpha hydrolase (AANH) superfamily ATPase